MQNSAKNARRFGWIGAFLAFAAGLCLLLTPTAWSAPTIFGFNFPCWGRDCYQSPASAKSLQALAKTGARWTSVVPTWYMDSPQSSLIRPTDSSPSDESLIAAIRQAKALGLSVALKPHVDLKNGGSRTNISPQDAAAWFADYTAMILHYARIAAQEHVDLFIVGTELSGVDGQEYRQDWKNVIAAARAAYSGPLTYAANWDHFGQVAFLDQLDYIGIDGYFPVDGGDDGKLLLAGWRKRADAIAAVSAAYGKPVMFTEIGIPSQQGANLRPWDCSNFGPLDLKVQKEYLKAFLRVFGSENWFAGFLVWGWDSGPGGGSKDTSDNIQGKPALKVLRHYFKRWRENEPSAAPPGVGSRAAARAAQILQPLGPSVFNGL